MATWCSDFCLACDQQTYGTAYCSQTCRLADLEISTPGFESTSPRSRHRRREGSYFGHANYSSSSQSTGPSMSVGHSKATRRTTKQGTADARDTTSQYLFGKIISESQSPSAANGCVSPSSSGGSLSSLQSSSSVQGRLSPQTMNALKSYADSFDRSRDLKRKKSQI